MIDVLNLYDGFVIMKIVVVIVVDVDLVVDVVMCVFLVWLVMLVVECGCLLLCLVDVIEVNMEVLVQFELLDIGYLICDLWVFDVLCMVVCFCYFGGMVDKL